MYTIRVVTEIAAPPERCFDLARSVEAHIESAQAGGEKVVGGRTSGLLELGDEIMFEARHFGIRQRLSSRVVKFERPSFFQDRMFRGAFKSLEHDHHFEPAGDGRTMMIDILRFRAPLGLLGWLAERMLLAGHLRKFLRERGAALKAMAEPGE